MPAGLPPAPTHFEEGEEGRKDNTYIGVRSLRESKYKNAWHKKWKRGIGDTGSVTQGSKGKV